MKRVNLYEFTDDEMWLIRDSLERRLDQGDFYSTDENGNENVYDEHLENEISCLYDELIEELKK
jgi:hypothetical protein